MRDRQKTIDALRRLAERPGTPAEGETARRKLRELEDQIPQAPQGYFPGVDQTPFERSVRASSAKYAKSEAEFKANLAAFFRGAGYVPRAKNPVTTWTDMEGVIRRHIYRGETGDVD